ncbi:hypothetical protein [Catenulispora subtropica]|uniref:Uncharacterized protein n=1 Tax=Catenulispora subtropica TaxID=450798 RepID=A0ABN2T1Q6_9ACTN
MKVLSFAAAPRHPRFRRVWAGQAASAVGDGPSEMLGRVFAIDTRGTFAMQPVGLAPAPVVAAGIGNASVPGIGLAALAITTVVPRFPRDVCAFADRGAAANAPVAGLETTAASA